MHILKTVVIILEVLILFNLLIFVHELGHFLAARWRGLKVDRFAIWFGKPIWKKKINGVEYAMGTIPFGGYVSLPQMAPMETLEGKSDEKREPLPPISALDKIIVAFAGPLFSFLLAFVFAVVVWGIGKPEQRSKNPTMVGWVKPEGPAWKAGLRPGDEILEIDGHVVTQFSPPAQDSVTWRIVTSEGEKIAVKYRRDGREITTEAMPELPPTKWYERKSLRKLQIGASYPAIIAKVITNSPAAVADLRKDDEIIMVNGEKIFSGDVIWAMQETFTNGPVKPTTFTIKRGAEQFERTLMAEKPLKPTNSSPVFGVALWSGGSDEVLAHPSPFKQIRDSATQIYATIKTIVSSKSDVGIQQLGGAVMIFRVYKTFFESENAWRRVLWFSVVLNVNLALINLLPFPVLDGGHITLALLEAIRKRPISAKFLEVVQTACALLLIGFMIFITFFDAGDWYRSRDVPIVFSPKQ